MDCRRREIVSLLIALFFADDGVLLTRSREALQRLLDVVVDALLQIGLLLSAKKTKILIIPPLSTKFLEYQALKLAFLEEGGVTARGRLIDLVDEFVYLGICLSWEWNWNSAWRFAQKRANRVLYLLRQVGFHNRGIPLVFQYRFACALVLSHLDTVSMLAGVDGHGKAIAENEKIVYSLLRMITGAPYGCSAEALLVESGTWDQHPRIRMLLLRFFCKICCSSHFSTHYRALWLSLAISRRHQRVQDAPSTKGASCRVTFFSRAWQASTFQYQDDADVFGLGDQFDFMVSRLRPCDSLVAVQRADEYGVWQTLDHHAVDDDLRVQRLRLVPTSRGAFRVNYSSSDLVYWWNLPLGTRIDAARSIWSHQLKEAVFASLRSRGNTDRNVLLRLMFVRWRTEKTSLRDLLPFTNSSFMHVAWYLRNVYVARRFLRFRMGVWGSEMDYRRAVHSAPRLKHSIENSPDLMSRVKKLLPRLESPEDRACYLCPGESWMPDSMSHLFLFCPHPSLASLRQSLCIALEAVIQRSATVQDVPPLPDIASDSLTNPHPEVDLFSILMLSTSVGCVDGRLDDGSACYTLSVLQAHRANEMDLRKHRAESWLRLDRVRMQVVANWLSFFFKAYREFLSTGSRTTSSEIGFDVIALVTTFCQRVFSIRRRLLRGNVEFLSRSRDPVHPERARLPVGSFLRAHSSATSDDDHESIRSDDHADSDADELALSDSDDAVLLSS
jgi:hypothetical protein